MAAVSDQSKDLRRSVLNSGAGAPKAATKAIKVAADSTRMMVLIAVSSILYRPTATMMAQSVRMIADMIQLGRAEPKR